MKNSLSVQTSAIYYAHIRLIIGFIIIAHAPLHIPQYTESEAHKRVYSYKRPFE